MVVFLSKLYMQETIKGYCLSLLVSTVLRLLYGLTFYIMFRMLMNMGDDLKTFLLNINSLHFQLERKFREVSNGR
jgi:hypothetical protein